LVKVKKVWFVMSNKAVIDFCLIVLSTGDDKLDVY